STIFRTEKINYPNNISRNVYRYLPENPSYNPDARHTYSSPGTYTIWLEDPNRNAGIQNIPNSVNIPLYIDTEILINPFLGYNSSPVLLNPPIDNGCVGQLYVHNPGAYDADGDSLSYRFITCRGGGGLPIPGYTLPPATDSIVINPITGDVFWDAPTKQGEFNLAILVEEWRNGVKIGSVTRDMQINIIACDHSPPVIVSIDDTCALAGDTLKFTVNAYDPDSDGITLTGTGGPFELSNNPAYIYPDPASGIGSTSTDFTWITLCSHVRKQPYYAFFKATDDGFPVNLVDIKTIGIRVIGPAPVLLSAEALGNTIRIDWTQYICPQISGYKVYRKNGTSGFVPGYCETGVPAYTGYTHIAIVTGHENIAFIDDNKGAGLVPGIQYCYMITAIFPDGSESQASSEKCAFLKKDLPIITNVSNDSSNLESGRVYLAWSKPTELDTIQYPGPYKYIIERATGISNTGFAEIAVMNGLNDTVYFDNGVNLNTSDSGYNYRIGLESQNIGFIGYSRNASSLELNALPSDQAITLQWSANVSWNNKKFIIFRKNPGSSSYDSLTSVNGNEFTDNGLINGQEYCYFIYSYGSYDSPGFFHPLLNFSPIRCSVPVDNVPPCPQQLQVTTECDKTENLLSWSNPPGCPIDIAKYEVYFKSEESEDFLLIAVLNSPFDTTFLHQNLKSVTGCYAVKAIDDNGNTGDFSNVVCIDYTACPGYELPNVFTPNNDHINDFFTPIPETVASVEKIEIKIFNRWGNLVFETIDPWINWDGKNQKNNVDCAEGVYFYVCDVYIITLQGIKKFTLQGSITLIR
ncbi:MAG: gliding motility-associated C-terminal domain-containing protein, partial [Bacteroidetes bacterium]|nr:gliding motility-associated C-terminal domain-containing protein [Bacteroidota bacterium]